ncbi:hypothetical protein Pmar_PMAR021084 [Perkinsus marinus ATCC 50983]|uniref:Uncharacterized protein n=1 Tax=Perkinsus marinus (strain ATCC 50983 / TXsc) TaxID=423536 RepID=C5KGD0_PERM5|nr:hypothetical protein Pmar_PMAR021084 [Perkinsus marinus ATCC 50983]EER16486.1 hypothetical protein Pmar_PMAR021084 [Perkinsus marinus ATCC 50983]|eukprot:XP_002784690.1 hypothetical protein Pmar_PMAR021084 [Perkinsus marinus ATCC 50983]
MADRNEVNCRKYGQDTWLGSSTGNCEDVEIQLESQGEDGTLLGMVEEIVVIPGAASEREVIKRHMHQIPWASSDRPDREASLIRAHRSSIALENRLRKTPEALEAYRGFARQAKVEEIKHAYALLLMGGLSVDML